MLQKKSENAGEHFMIVRLYNQIDNYSIIAYERVLRRTAYPVTGAQAAQYALGPFEMITNYLIRL